MTGVEESRHTGWSASDPTRRRNPGPLVNSANLSKQKSPVSNDPAHSKDAMVSYSDTKIPFPMLLTLVGLFQC